MVEIVTQIKSAEEQADEIRRVARQQARQLREDGIAAGKAHLEAESEKAAAGAAKIAFQADDAAKAYLEEFAAKSAQEFETLSAAAKARMPKASAFIVERIVASL